MLTKFDTDIGKIYCSYNEDTDNYIMLRVIDIYDDNGIKKVKLCRIGPESNFKIDFDNDKFFVEMEFNEFETKIKKDWTLLKSCGMISVTNIVAINDPVSPIKDVILIYFPNNKASLVPDPRQPFAIARQGINNIFADMAGIDTVGLSVSIDTLPAGYSLSDFMHNESTLSSKLTHAYMIDTCKSIGILLKNDESDKILDDMYHHALRFKKNTIDNYEEPNDFIIDGYCKYFTDMIENTGFIDEVYNHIGVVKMDKPIKEEPIGEEDKLFLSILCGGIKINKCVPLKFNFDININLIKMKYLMVMDSDGALWICPYTEFPDEISVDEVYKLTDERTTKIQDRLISCVKAYDQSKGIKSGTINEIM